MSGTCQDEKKRKEMARCGEKFEGKKIIAQRFVFMQNFNHLVSISQRDPSKHAVYYRGICIFTRTIF